MSAIKSNLNKKLLNLIKDLLERIKVLDQKVQSSCKDKACISFYLLLIDTIIADVQKLNDGGVVDDLISARYQIFYDAANSCDTTQKGLKSLEEKR